MTPSKSSVPSGCMQPSSITVPLLLGIVGTIGFNLSPIVLGAGMTMNGFFMVYALIMLVLSFADRRVLGYATVLSACNPANSIANLSFSFLLAVLTVFKESPNLWRAIRKLSKHHWWWLFLAAFLLIGLSALFWSSDTRTILTEVKQALSRLGYIAVLPLAVALTLHTSRDGVRVVSLLCLMSVTFLVIFFFRGQAATIVISDVRGGDTVGIEQFVGNVSLNFNRTQVCILLAALAAVALALGPGAGLNLRAAPFYLASGVCVFMIMFLASVGSAFAMACGMAVVSIGFFGHRFSLGRILLGGIIFSIVGMALFWAIFQTENMLSQRYGLKMRQIERSGIDRFKFWEEGIEEIRKAPFGEGWSSRTGHSDWLLFLLSYGWASGLLYFFASGWLFLSLSRSLLLRKTATDLPTSKLLLVGLAALTVYVVNSILDMLSANIGYYEIVWTLILTSATVVTVANATTQAEKMSKHCPSPLPLKRQYRAREV